MKQASLPSRTSVATAERQRVYYGWWMLPIAVALFVVTFPGQTFGISIFNEPIRTTLGLSHGRFALAYTLGTLIASVPLTLVGGYIDRRGLRRASMLAIVGFGAACMMLSQATGWWTLLLAFFALRLLGPGVLSLLSSNTLAFWFQRRLGFVEGVRQLGMAGAMVFIPALNLWLVQAFGWRSSYLILGGGVWLLLPLVVILFRERPESVGQSIDGGTSSEPGSPAGEIWGLTLREAARCRAFWIVGGGTSLFSIIHTAVFFSIVPILGEHGVGKGEAATVLTCFAVSLAVMHLVGGTLADWCAPRVLLPLAMGALGLALGVMLQTESVLAAMGAGVLLGVAQGLFFGTSNPLWARYFGLRHLGKIRGAVGTVNVATSSIGPMIAGVLRDASGSFDLPLQCFCIASLVMACFSLSVSPPRANAFSVAREPS